MLKKDKGMQRRYIIKHRDDHYDHFGGCWVLLIILVMGLIITWIVAAASNTSVDPHLNQRQKEKQKVLSRDCGLGEEFNHVLGLCAPKKRYPVAAESEIINQEVSACDSFFHHSCGKWIEQHQNEDRGFSYVYRENAFAIRNLILKETQKSGSPVGAFYQSCLDRERHAGETILERKYAKTSILGDFWKLEDLPVVLGRLTRFGYTAPLSITIENHPYKPEMIPLLRWDGFEATAEEAAIVFASDKHNSFMDTSAKVTHFLNIQHKLKEKKSGRENSITSYKDYLESNDFERQDTILYKSLVNEQGGKWRWHTYLREIDGTAFPFDDHQLLWTFDKEYLRWFSRDESITLLEWRAWIEYSILYHTHEFVPQLPDDSYFRKHAWAPVGPHFLLPHILKKSPEKEVSKENQCLRLTQYLLPGLVSELFIEQEFDNVEATRTRVRKLGEEVRDSLAGLIEHTAYLDPSTKSNLVRKVRAIIVRAVHPNQWDPEPFASRLTSDRYLHNLDLIRRFRVRQNLVQWRAYDRDVVARFGAPLSTVNAFYSPSTNTITIFAGILRAPFYDDRFNVASVTASLGSVIGHEFSHSIDSSGAHFDETGSYRRLSDVGWFSPASKAGFQRQLDCVVQEYSADGLDTDCSSISKMSQNYGQNTLGENMADIVGVKSAYATYLRLANETEQSQSNRMWWWVTFAQMWCEHYDQAHICARVDDDVHSVSLFRVDKTLRNIRHFKDDYQCALGENMNRVDEERCAVFGP